MAADEEEDIDPFTEVEPTASRNDSGRRSATLNDHTEAELIAKNKLLEQQNAALKRNITCLFKTAKMEINRYKELVSTLEEEKLLSTKQPQNVEDRRQEHKTTQTKPISEHSSTTENKVAGKKRKRPLTEDRKDRKQEDKSTQTKPVSEHKSTTESKVAGKKHKRPLTEDRKDHCKVKKERNDCSVKENKKPHSDHLVAVRHKRRKTEKGDEMKTATTGSSRHAAVKDGNSMRTIHKHNSERKTMKLRTLKCKKNNALRGGTGTDSGLEDGEIISSDED